MKRLILIFLFCAFSASLRAEEKCGRLLPVDEAAQDVSFLFFRDKLAKSLQEKDPSVLRGFLAAKAKTGPDSPEAAPQDFFGQWSKDNPGRDLWAEMEKTLSRGGAFKNPKTFEAPYVSARWAKATSCEAEDRGAILGTGVQVYLGPKDDAEILTTLSNEIVPFETLRQNPEWARITFGLGKTGYVLSRQIASPLDYRALFKKQNGVWVLTSFVRGE